jgi:hypothetical protein
VKISRLLVPLQPQERVPPHNQPLDVSISVGFNNEITVRAVNRWNERVAEVTAYAATVNVHRPGCPLIKTSSIELMP